MLTLGYYPDNYKKRKSERFDKQYVVFNEKYRKLSEEELKDMYKIKEKKIKNIDKILFCVCRSKGFMPHYLVWVERKGMLQM
jgi:hypothetical protein